MVSWRQVDPLLLLELLRDIVDQSDIEVVAAEMGVAAGAQHLEHLGGVPLPGSGDFEHGHVERAASQVEHHDLLIPFLIEPVRQGRRRRLVDDPQDLHPSDLPGILGGLALRVVDSTRAP